MQAFEVEEFKKLADSGHTIVDVRSAEELSLGQIPGSLAVFFNESFPARLADVTEDDDQLLLIADDNQLAALQKAVRAANLANVKGYLQGGVQAWQAAGNAIDMLIFIEADELKMDYQFDEFYLIDTRSAEEFAEERLEDAENIPLADLALTLPNLETTNSYYVYGSTALDAITAGSLFKRNGFERLRIVADDYEKIKTAGIPLFTLKKKKGDKSSPKEDSK
ncbi:MAG: rhodanese-like domain-containing protein [Chitinophagales bacterium]